MVELVRKLTDHNRNFVYESFKQIIDKPELNDVPIAIYSLSGPTRTGKSYLLNVFYHLLREHSVCDETLQDEFQEVFKSTSQVESETDGIYMTTKPFYKGCGSDQVAIFLMDTQGINAGDKVGCKEADFFAISSTLSFWQIVNLKQDFEWIHFDTYATLTFYTKVLEVKRNGVKRLTVVVRDWECPAQYREGRRGGNLYLEDVKLRPALSRHVLCMDDNYPTFECFLLSHPGRRVARTNTRRIQDIDIETWQEIRDLHQLLFSQDNLNQAIQEAPKGKDILRLAQNMQMTMSASQLHQPESTFENFFDSVMKNEVEVCLQRYISAIEPFRNVNGEPYRLKHKAAKEQAETQMLRFSIGDINEYSQMLNKKIEEDEIENGFRTIQKFVDMWNSKMKKKGNFKTSNVYDSFLNEGKCYLETLTQQILNENSRKVVVKKLQDRLGKSYKEERKRRKKNKKIAACIAATFLGVCGVGVAAAIPAAVATAVAAEIAAEGVLAGMAAGSTGLFGGLIGVAASTYHGSQKGDDPPNLDPDEMDEVDEAGEIHDETARLIENFDQAFI